MSESLRNLSDIEYGASPKQIRSNDFTTIRIYGTGGHVGYSNEVLFKGPLVVVARKGTLDNPIYVAGDCWVIDTAYAVLPKKNVEAKWLYYNLANFDLKKLNESTGVPSISRDYLYRVTFEYFPQPEQRKIARILSAVDTVIEKTEASIAKYEAIKEGMMHDLFTRGIDIHTGKLRQSYEDAPELYKLMELGVIPKDWDVKYVNEVSENLDGKRVPIKESKREEIKGNIPYYGASGIIDYINAFIFDEPLILLGEDGENVVSRNLPLAFIISGKTWVNNHAHVLKPNSDMDIVYLAEYLEYLEYSDIISGSAQPKITQKMLNRKLVKKPLFSEQTIIAKRMNAINSTLFKERKILNKYQQLKKALMGDLLTGKVRVKYEEGEMEEV